MTNELFPIESVYQLSPRYLWMNKHRLLVFHSKNEDPEEAWTAYRQEDIDRYFEHYSTGATEDEAICNWAKANKVRLWNEEGLK